MKLTKATRSSCPAFRLFAALVVCIAAFTGVVPTATHAQPSMLDPTVTQVVAGLNHSCALTTAGGVKCWGSNATGQLGDGTLVNRTSPVDVATLTSGVVAITAGDAHTCALLLNGGLKCWGDNVRGQLGDSSFVSSATPVDVYGYTAGVAAVSAGATHNCAVTVSAGVVCWGGNSNGQLGHSGTTNSFRAYEAVYLNLGVIGIAAGGTHSCALTIAGGVKCWGGNGFGQLGDGTFVDYDNNIGEAVNVVNLASGIKAITAGSGHTCGVTTAGGVKCWGGNASFQLGDGTQINRNIPISTASLGTSLSTVIGNITAGAQHTCATTVAGALKCWGGNATFQLGDGTSINKGTPINVTGQTADMANVAAGGSHSCGLTKYGGVRCWGGNTAGQVGDETSTTAQTAVDVSELTGGVLVVSGGVYTNCALTTSGGVKCWGYGLNGELGNGVKTNNPNPVTAIGLGRSTAAVSVGGSHACALVAGGAVKCWGANFATNYGATPVVVPTLSSGVVAISVGENHSCALTGIGGVKCWGYNASGQLGNGLVSDSSTPVAVNGLTSGVVRISAGFNHTCALSTTSGVLCWGANDLGQLGNGTTTGSPVPVPATGLMSGVVAISAGRPAHTCALTSSGGAKCWGSNFAGQLGNNSTVDSWVPVDVSGFTSGLVTVAAGGYHSCALTTSGSVKCWGSNVAGTLGIGGSSNSLMPADVISLTSGALDISVHRDRHNCVLLPGDAIKCWGYNNFQSLGNNQTAPISTVPIDVRRGQAISFVPPAQLVVGAGASALSATASSALAPTFSSWTPTTCTLSGNNVTAIAAGLCGLRVSQVNPGSYALSPQKLVLVPVIPAYAITATVSPTSSGTVVCTPNPVPEGSNATCAATAATGYTFSAFSGDCTGASCALNNVTSDKNVTATFTVSTFTITTAVSPAGSGSVSCTPNPVPYNGSATCTPTAAAGYTFSAWSGDCTGATCTLTNVTSAKNVTATFTLIPLSITTTVSPATGGIINCTPNPVPYGGNATCVISSATGYTFIGWSGSCTGPTCSLTNVTTAQSVTASFTINVTGTVSPSGSGTVTCVPNKVVPGGASTCTAAATSGYVFVGFSVDCTGLTCALSNILTPKNVTANFKLSQAITWAPLAPAARPLNLVAPFALNPLATGGGSGNLVIYSSATPLVCSVTGTSVSTLGLGTCTITVSQAGNANYSAAIPVSQNVSIFATLDVDASTTSGTQYHAGTDGLLIMRYLLNMTGSALTTGATGPTAARTDPVALLAHLNAMRSALDVDGNTIVDPATDGVLILRYLLGFRGSALIAGAVGLTPTPSRPTAALIELYLQGLMP